MLREARVLVNFQKKNHEVVTILGGGGATVQFLLNGYLTTTLTGKSS